jgi:hypothetical protein
VVHPRPSREVDWCRTLWCDLPTLPKFTAARGGHGMIPQRPAAGETNAFQPLAGCAKKEGAEAPSVSAVAGHAAAYLNFNDTPVSSRFLRGHRRLR